MKKKLLAGVLALTLCGTGLSALAAEELAVQNETITEAAEEVVLPTQEDRVEATSPQETQTITVEESDDTISVSDEEAEAAKAIVKSGTCGEHATWTLDEDGTLTISGTGDTVAGSIWPDNRVFHVIVEDGITGIGDELFFHYEQLKTVQLADSVTSIGDHAFGDTALTSISLSKNVQTLGSNPFLACFRLESLEVDAENPNLKVENGVLYNKDQSVMLSALPRLAGTFRMPDSVRTVEAEAMAYCRNVTDLQLSKNLRTIKQDAFYGCKGLKKFVIPASVTDFHASSLCACQNIKKITVARGNRAYVSIDGVLFRKDKRTLVLYPAGKSGDTYTVPKSVTHIGEYAFYDVQAKTRVKLPSALTEIGAYGFYNYRQKEIELPKHLTKIGYRAFFESSLYSITIPKSVTDFGEECIGYIWDDDYSAPLLEELIGVGKNFATTICGKPFSNANVYADENKIPFCLDAKLRNVKLTKGSNRNITVTWDKNRKLSRYHVELHEYRYGWQPLEHRTTSSGRMTFSKLKKGRKYWLEVYGTRKYNGTDYKTVTISKFFTLK